MNIENTKVTKLKLTELDRLDPVHIFAEDIEKSIGRITITCYGKAWSAYWGGMGDKTIAEFFCSCSEDYIYGNLSDIDSEVYDYDAISKAIGEEVDEHWLMSYAQKLEDNYGEDWYHLLPKKTNSEYSYLCRIIKAVQAGFTKKAAGIAA